MNAIDGIDMTHSSHWNQGFRRIAGALALLGALAAAPAMAQPAAATHSFGWKGEQFLLDGKPFVIRGGEMHFSRVPREHWRDRLRMMKAMGLNTVGTYLFWNLHEPRPGQFDFSGQNDIAEFVRIAQEEGLWVILRPGPYACAEWELGGFPAWLLKTPDLRIRTSDPRYVAAATRFLGEVGKRLALYPNRGLPVPRSRVSYRRLDGTNTNGSGKAGWAETLDRFGHGRFFRGPQFSVVTIVYA